LLENVTKMINAGLILPDTHTKRKHLSGSGSCFTLFQIMMMIERKKINTQ